MLALLGLVLSQSEGQPFISDPWDAFKAYGIASPVIVGMYIWIRQAIKERDDERARADIERQKSEALMEKLLDQQKELIPFVKDLIAVAERIEQSK